MMMETDVVAFAQIVFHSEAGQRDSENRVIILQLLHQIDAAAIGQTDVADQDIELFVRRRFQRGLNAMGGLDVIAAAPQEQGQ